MVVRDDTADIGHVVPVHHTHVIIIRTAHTRAVHEQVKQDVRAGGGTAVGENLHVALTLGHVTVLKMATRHEYRTIGDVLLENLIVFLSLFGEFFAQQRRVASGHSICHFFPCLPAFTAGIRIRDLAQICPTRHSLPHATIKFA